MSTALPTGTLDERPQPVKALRVYLRQSTDQKQQTESAATQRGACERLAYSLGVSQIEWARRIEYVDIDRSGGDFQGREELTRLLRDVRAGDIVLAWKQDRVGRDTIDSVVTIRELVKYRRCLLYTTDCGTVPIKLDTAADTGMVMLRGMVSQGELENIRKNTRDGLRARARDGFATGTVPFGFRTMLVDPNVADRKKSKKRIAIDDTAAPTIRRLVAMYLDGNGYRAIAKALNKEGAPSPRGHGWSSTSVWELLREPRYAGYWTHGERRVVGRVGKKSIMEKAPEEDIIRIDRPDLAIIPRDLWARVQEALAKRTRDMPARLVASASAVVHPLSNLLTCGECGGLMRVKTCHSRTTEWTRRYYVCASRLRSGRCSNDVHIPGDEVEGKLREYLCSDVLDRVEKYIRDAIRAEVINAADTANARASEAERIGTEIESLRRERKRLVRLAAATDDPVPEIADALSTNHARDKALAEAMTVATRPAIDRALAERLEASTCAQVDRLREQLATGELRQALTVLVPNGLRFKVASGLWLIEGAASVPTVRQPDKIRIPVAT